MQLPPTILSIDKHEKKKKTKEASSTKLPKKDGNTESLQGVDTAESVAISMDDLTLSDSDLEGSLDGDKIIAEDELPQTKPLAKAEQTKSKSLGLRPPRTLETTLFDRLERMYGTSIKRMLKVQYRSAFLHSVKILYLLMMKFLIEQNAFSNMRISIQNPVFFKIDISRVRRLPSSSRPP